MEQQIVQINFQFTGTLQDFKASATSIAGYFAETPGLQWKIWLLNEERKEAGGIYLFTDKIYADAYRESALFRKINANPEFINLSVKQFATMDSPGVITNAPVVIHHLN